MKKQTIVKLFVAAVAVIACNIPLNAGSWDWTRPYKMPEKNVNTLIVTGNYRKPRLLAELIQVETKQPILLVPSSSDGKIFFMPDKDQAMAVELEDLTDFIKYLKPGKIIVLGDKRFVPDKYLKAIDPAQTVISVSNKDWYKVSKTVTRILSLTYLDRDFRKLEAKIESGELYRPGKPGKPVIEDKPPVKDEDSIVIVDETEIKESTIIVEDGTGDARDKKVKEAEITSEPKLVEEGKVPQK